MNDRLRKLIIKLNRNPGFRKEAGLYCIEGPKMAREADPDLIRYILVTEEFLLSRESAGVKALLKNKSYSVVSAQEMKKLSDTVSPQGILAVAEQKIIGSFGEFIEAENIYRNKNRLGAPLILMLETIQDPGNLGTILRSAEAAGVSGIISDEGTVSLYSPKVVRSTMGAIGRIPYISVRNLSDAAGSVRERTSLRDGIIIFAAAASGRLLYTDADLCGPSALMIGNESRGLSKELLDLADFSISIPMKGKTESLNAAAAASVICFEAARQRDRTPDSAG